MMLILQTVSTQVTLLAGMLCFVLRMDGDERRLIQWLPGS